LRISPALFAFGLAACAGSPPPAAAPSAALAAPPSASLAGTRWIGAMPTGSDPRTIPRLEFVGEGRLSGYTGCNMVSGVWTMEGADVRIGALVTTKRLCVGPERETERQLLGALRDGARGHREGGRLVFTGPAGERFEFAEAAAT
jgi:heat shock protein HslJ